MEDKIDIFTKKKSEIFNQTNCLQQKKLKKVNDAFLSSKIRPNYFVEQEVSS